MTEHKMTGGASPPFSHPVRPSALGPEDVRFELEADPGVRATLARLFGLVDVAAFRAVIRLKWVRGGRILRLSGRLHAEIVQTCVITLEPVENTIEESFEILFKTRSADAEPDSAALEGEADAMAAAEPLDGDSVDIAEVAAGELALAIDPYPRKTGASLEPPPGPGGWRAPPNEGTGRASPFEMLAALKGKK